MATTYSVNSDLVLDNGKSIDDFLDATLSTTKKTERKDAARLRAYNHINDKYLRGKMVIPSTISSLKQIEIDLVIADIMLGSFSGESFNTATEWAVKYRERAEETLANLRFDASVEDAVAAGNNTGNGTVGSLSVNNQYTKTEIWNLTAQNSSYFSVRGSISGSLPNARVGIAYPEKEWTGGRYQDYNLVLSNLPYEEYPIYFTIATGVIAFAVYDRFSFRTYAASYYRRRIGEIIRG